MSGEPAFHPKSLLLASGKPEDGLFAAEVAAACGIPLVRMPEASAAADLMSQQDVLLIADVSTTAMFAALESAITNKVGIFSARVNANFIHFIVPGFDAKIDSLVASPLYGNLITRPDQARAIEAGRRYGRICRAAIKGKAGPTLERILPEKGETPAQHQEIKLTHTHQKRDLLVAVRDYAVAAGFLNRSVFSILTAVDELVTNAIFDAPLDATAKPLRNAAPRDGEFELPGRESVTVRIAFNGELLAVEVTDEYGSLDKARFATKIARVGAQAEDFRAAIAPPSAGIGLALTLASGGSLLYVADQGTRTRATVFFVKRDRFRAQREDFRFLGTHFLFGEES